MEFQGKTAIITGAASGMGLLAGQRLAAEGARVVLTDVDEEKVKACAEAIRADGGEAIGVRVDVRDFADIEKAVDSALEKYGSVDILINSAGGAARRIWGRKEPFHELPVEVIEWGIDVNLKGAVLFCRGVLGRMIKQKHGVIINISSISGMHGSRTVDYCAAKRGIVGLTEAIALCGAQHGVRCCCVTPGPVLTRAAMANMKTPLGRAAEPGEVVDLILYLISDKAAYITGSNHLIDGGYCLNGRE